MPNWCSNNLSITGPKDKIKALWDHAQKPEEEGGGLLRGMRPEPDYNKVDVMPTYPGIVGNNDPVEKSQSWWDWRVQNWGTKWEVSNEGLQYTENEDGIATISGWFESAWAPPVDAIAYFCDEQDDITARLAYYEPGMCFVGEWTSQEGDECYEYSEHNSKNVRDRIGAYLDDMWNISEELAQYEEEEQGE